MRRVDLAALTVMLVFSGCDTVTHWHNSRSGLTQADLDRDKYQCRRENSAAW
jgi:hypothetical protein